MPNNDFNEADVVRDQGRFAVQNLNAPESALPAAAVPTTRIGEDDGLPAAEALLPDVAVYNHDTVGIVTLITFNNGSATANFWTDPATGHVVNDIAVQQADGRWPHDSEEYTTRLIEYGAREHQRSIDLQPALTAAELRTKLAEHQNTVAAAMQAADETAKQYIETVLLEEFPDATRALFRYNKFSQNAGLFAVYSGGEPVWNYYDIRGQTPAVRDINDTIHGMHNKAGLFPGGRVTGANSEDPVYEMHL